MKKRVIASLALLFAACGDDVTQINQTGLDVFASEDDLPECTGKSEGEQAVVKGETSIRVCMDGEWVAMKDDFTCKTVELKDKSGYKIVCNGDSIGVVLNGKDGENGEDGKDAEVAKPDTTVNDSEKIAISLDSLVGVTQKGPFLKGSTVYLYELSDGRTLKQTNGNFTSNITSEDGRYKFTARDLVSQYAMVVVDGYYRNEVTGKISDAPIRLKAITDMRKRNSVNVNILTHLEFDRVYNLVTRGDRDGKKLTVKQAKRQAQKEILKLFSIELDDDTDAEDMDVFGKTDADAALLAISVLLQGDGNATDLSVLLTEISNSIAEKGEWNDSTAMGQLALWTAVADGQGRLDSISSYVKGWGLGNGIVPPFEKYVRNFYSKETGMGPCDVHGTMKKVKRNTDSLLFLCADTISGRWRLFSDFDKDTLGWGHDFEPGDVRRGKVDTTKTYVYENGNWRYGTSLDGLLGLGCIRDFKDTLKSVSSLEWYKCVVDTVLSLNGFKWTSAWRRASDLELDMDYWKRNKDKTGELLKGSFTGKTLVWDADTLREPNSVEQSWNRACVTAMYGSMDTLSNGLAYACSDSGWSKTGKFKDKRDEKIYKGVKIGKRTWMAENLNYVYKDLNGVVVGNFCYDNEPANCERYGRLYRWSAAMDSVHNGKCGDGKTCNVALPTQGVCPLGWHLPSKAEWDALYVEELLGDLNVGAVLLKSVNGWKKDFDGSSGGGTDALFFTVLPAGFEDNGRFFSLGDMTYIWSSNESTTGDAYRVDFGYNIKYMRMESSPKFRAFSVRCIKDYSD